MKNIYEIRKMQNIGIEVLLYSCTKEQAESSPNGVEDKFKNQYYIYNIEEIKLASLVGAVKHLYTIKVIMIIWCVLTVLGVFIVWTSI